MGEDPSEPEQKADLPHDQQQQEENPRNQWPSSPSAAFFRPALYRYYSHVRAFARRLLGIFALALDLPEDYFDSIATFPMAGVRAIHYPPQEVSSDVGIGAHTDYSWFTLVCQTAPPALEVLNGNGIWVPAKPTPRTFVVNIGDFLKLVTGGTWLSTVHRVRNMTGEERYSMPFFFSPNEDSCIKVLEAFRDPVKSYDDISVRDYYDQRLKAARKENAAKPSGSNQMSRSVAVAS
jgi:isopenicillin N synthase-like dioxygenase